MGWAFAGGLVLGWVTALAIHIVAGRTYLAEVRRRQAMIGLDPMWQHAKEMGSKISVSVEAANGEDIRE